MQSQMEMNWFQKLRQITSNKLRKNKLSGQDYELIREKILSEETPFYAREAYKALRTNLIFSLPSNGCKKLIVTSSLASEGKSTNCLNMAITFAEMDAKVLIIDCDLRKPNLARLLNVQNAPGLSNLLVGLNTREDIIHESEFKNLSYITAGNIPPNPVELLDSDKMKCLIEELEKDFDYIFFDTPPVNMVIDAVVVSKYVHGVVMIALQNSTDKEAMRYTLNQLNFAGAKVLGFVLNGVEFANTKAYKNISKKNYMKNNFFKSKKSKAYIQYGYGSYGEDKSFDE